MLRVEGFFFSDAMGICWFLTSILQLNDLPSELHFTLRSSFGTFLTT